MVSVVAALSSFAMGSTESVIHGSADKVAVHQAAADLWRPLWTPGPDHDDNESDALVLASMGAQWLNVLAPIYQPPRDALARCEWPD